MKFLETKYGDLSSQDVTIAAVNIGGKNIDSLEGCPDILRGSLNAFTNDLEDLKGAPREVYGNVSFQDNLLTSLKGSLEMVVGNLDLSDNKLKNFDGSLRKVTGDLFVKDLQGFATIGDIENALMAANIIVGGKVIGDSGDEFKQDPAKIQEFSKGNRIGVLGDFL